jgi:hypothetical protein
LLDWLVCTLFSSHASAFENFIFVDLSYKTCNHQDKKAEKKDGKINIKVLNDKFFSLDAVHFPGGIGHGNVLRKVNDLIEAGCIL